MKKYLYATLILCAAIFISSCSMASGGGSDSGSGSGESQTDSNTWANNYPSTTVTAAEAAQTIEGLAENKTVVLTGSIDSSQLTSIKNAINSGSHNVNLDLSNTTGLITISLHAFSSCSKLSGIALPSSVTSIFNYAFCECTGLTQISIPSSVTSIGQHAFGYCTGLTQISIPSSVTSIDIAAFGGCTWLTSINVDNSNSTYKSINGVLFNKTATRLIIYPQGKSDSEYTIPSSVTSIDKEAFGYCTELTQVFIPSSVTTIGDGAFYSCSGLTQISIPSSVTSIGQVVFAECTGLTSITFEGTSGWHTTTNSSYSDGTPIDVSNPEDNVQYFQGAYFYNYLYKE